jgi:D-beta-D-heptose 7-phosphate kinase/D-beta-D-heptose 1-phosphate adenosyltransferase
MILVVGDIMLDEYVRGEATRLAPEAPVPVVLLGGAPLLKLGGAANTAASVAALGEDVALVGPYGADRADDLRRLCEAAGIALLGRPNVFRTTTVKTRVIDGDSRLLIRLDRESPQEWAEGGAELRDALAASDPSTVVFSDYAKGCWTRSVWWAVADHAGSRAEPGAAPRLVVDAKRRLEAFDGAGIVKCNRAEWIRLDGDFSCPAESCAVVTKGKAGLSWAGPADGGGPRVWRDIRAAEHDMLDVTGAGDVVTAVVAVGVHRGIPLERTLESAVRASSASVTRPMTGVADPRDVDL